MNKTISFTCSLVLALLLSGGTLAAADYVPTDYVWTTQSHNSSESMPCGGHDIGLNVWVEQGDLLFYACQSGWFDENNTLLKAGRWRLHFDDAPFDGNDFCQRLCLDDGAVSVSGGGVKVRLWVDVFEPVVSVAMTSQHTERATLSYESWRYRDRQVTKAECQQCSYKWIITDDCTTFADSIKASGSQLTFCHRNRPQTVFDFTVSYERLDAIKDSLYNPIGGLLMEGTMEAPGFRFTGTTDGTYASTDYRAWNFRNERLKRSTITIRLTNNRPGDKAAAVAPSKGAAKREVASARWWHDFWQRSWIKTDNAEAAPMVRNYELMRYMLGCNAYGQWPTKFNGGLFTFDPVYVDSTMAFTPDFRRWGGGTMTAQNQRLIYWPMLKSGDDDMMSAQIDTYLRMLPNAVARTRHYWGHGGASFTEQMENFGLPNPAEYGKHPEGSDLGVERNAWLEYMWDTALEFAQMALLSSTQRDKGALLATEVLRFFDEHYRWQARQLGIKPLDEQGHLIIYPGSGCETHKMAYNPASTIAALRAVSEQLSLVLHSQESRATASTTPNFSISQSPNLPISQSPNLPISQSPNLPISNFLSSIPPLPFCTFDGDTCIAPAVVWARINNEETPQLYPVWPWRLYGLGRPNLHIAQNTYLKDPYAQKMHSSKGWKQDNIWAACLGLTNEARRLNLEKLADGPYRFTAFWPPGYDWAPDHNRGGAGMIGLQEMLLQETPDGELLLFPAWPREWDASFRLHASDGRTVEATLTNGAISLKQPAQ